MRAVSLFFRCLDCKSFFKAFGCAFGRFRVQFLITFGFFFASLPCAHSPICRSSLSCQHYASASSFSCLYNHVNHGCGPGDLVHCSRVPCLQMCKKIDVFCYFDLLHSQSLQRVLHPLLFSLHAALHLSSASVTQPPPSFLCLRNLSAGFKNTFFLCSFFSERPRPLCEGSWPIFWRPWSPFSPPPSGREARKLRSQTLPRLQIPVVTPSTLVYTLFWCSRYLPREHFGCNFAIFSDCWSLVRSSTGSVEQPWDIRITSDAKKRFWLCASSGEDPPRNDPRTLWIVFGWRWEILGHAKTWAPFNRSIQNQVFMVFASNTHLGSSANVLERLERLRDALRCSGLH